MNPYNTLPNIVHSGNIYSILTLVVSIDIE